MKANLELSKEEGEALFYIFDAAVKSAGISGPISRNVNHFIDKINAAFSEPVKKTEAKEELTQDEKIEAAKIIKP